MVGDLVLRSQRSLLGLFPDLRLPLCSNVSCFFYEEVCPMPGLMESGSGSPSGACALSCDQTLCDPIDCSPPGSSVRGIFQAQILEWVAISFSRGSSRPRDWTCVSYIPCTGRRILYQCTTWDDPGTIQESWFLLSSGNQNQIWQWARRPEGFLIAQSVKSLPEMQETWAQFLCQKDPLKKDMETRSSEWRPEIF